MSFWRLKVFLPRGISPTMFYCTVIYSVVTGVLAFKPILEDLKRQEEERNREVLNSTLEE